MATDSLHRLILEYDNEYSKNCSVNLEAACPIIIDFCDASANSRNFSESIVNYHFANGLPVAYFTQEGQKELMLYLCNKTDYKNEAITRLEAFFSDGAHRQCLSSLQKLKTYNEFNLQVILAAHLFGPLAGIRSYKIGNKEFQKERKARECPGCKKDITDTIDNTSLVAKSNPSNAENQYQKPLPSAKSRQRNIPGNGNVWHGYADILVNRSIVKIKPADDEDDVSGEPLHKRARTGSFGEDKCSVSDESFESDNSVEDKEDVIGSHAISQGLAQTIVNAFCEVKKNPTLSSSFIPSFIATGENVRITMYNCESDRLIMTNPLKIFTEKNSLFNISTILSLWYALNYKISVDEKVLEIYKKSNFREQAGQKFSIYENNCAKPMVAKDSKSIFGAGLDSRSFLDPFCTSIKEMIKLNAEFISVFNGKAN